MVRVTSRPATGRPRSTPHASSAPRQDTAARPGRKRSEQSRMAILAAAYELAGEIGYARLTIEGIAARSGTGKQTIYRWWPSKGDVVLDALATKADLHVPIPDEGSYPADLRAFLLASFALGRQSQLIEVLRALMAQAQIDPAFWQRFRNAFLQRRRDALGIRSEEHTSELQSHVNLVCRLLLEKKKKQNHICTLEENYDDKQTPTR